MEPGLSWRTRSAATGLSCPEPPRWRLGFARRWDFAKPRPTLQDPSPPSARVVRRLRQQAVVPGALGLAAADDPPVGQRSTRLGDHRTLTRRAVLLVVDHDPVVLPAGPVRRRRVRVHRPVAPPVLAGPEDRQP